MSAYLLTAPAKINLYLEILGDRPDGFHELVMVMQTIGLYDRIGVRQNRSGEINLYCQHPEVPLTASNIAYRAAQLMMMRFADIYTRVGGGVDITIEKNIPVAAGLAGGSTDGAAVLVGLNLLWDLGLTQPELQTLAAELGSDVPFCIGGGTAIATGRGEILDPLPDLDGIPIVLAKYSNIAVSTPWAYQTYRAQFGEHYLQDAASWHTRMTQIHSGGLIKAIQQKNIQAIARELHNDLEKVVLPEFPQVQQLRDCFTKHGAIGTMMSGSGPSVFALCETLAQAQALKVQVAQELNDPALDLWVTHIASPGIQADCR
ncbi:4-(cytidine 5'-diphospho)-2-C-methyl-D-erythritol kinase [Picosynechococcus sp. PCC 11901]|uniref:4-(cytidine 5'-diphospho)-2-C-methyl-D-erythritol kinase n=1 Tax=Picosynechococcus sp. PCC 11901 TaxID=2579791 RepID=UPI0010FC327F|nr:4-(cytidine 5'-diphospho)-2-C-methyl-D-erythritol kinase [Picosynechococcus sp. PCC 11901]QCS48242.1 4-(cytidine 5'-diphospho)-2-C-methyl-D-erythritol kinase [Picosynechococcus sp. PCC 11901]